MTAPLLVLSNIIIDDLWLADGTHLPSTLGGAATYAATAARLWWDDVAIVAGVGTDLEAVTGGRLASFGLRDAGYLRRSRHSIQSRLVYNPDGTRTETAAFGAEHFARLQVLPEEIPAGLLPAAGTYVFRDLDPVYWRSLAGMRGALGTILWELHDERIAGRWPEIAALMPLVELFSCNLNEAEALFGPMPPEGMVDAILATGVQAVVLRMGARGALVATREKRLRVVPPPSPVIDVTGGGNAFSGGFLAGWLRTPGDLEQAARAAAASAAHALGQFGPANPLARGETLHWAAATGILPVA